MHYDRRQFGGMLAAALTLPSLTAAALDIRGVDVGIQSYTFHDVREGGLAAVDRMIADMHAMGMDLLELWAPQIEPFPMPAGYWHAWTGGDEAKAPMPPRPTAEAAKAQREKLRAWRIAPPADYFASIRRKFDVGKVRVFAYNYSFDPTMTDDEIDAGFLHAKAMGLDLITASSRVSMAKRVVPFAAKHNLRVAYHGHSAKGDPDQICGPETFDAALAMSPLYRVNLDVAHYAAAGFDPLPYLKQHHDKITNLHVHDRKANDGESVPFGEGIAPNRAVLTLLRDQKWKMPVFYELEYVGRDGRDVVAETKKEMATVRAMLES